MSSKRIVELSKKKSFKSIALDDVLDKLQDYKSAKFKDKSEKEIFMKAKFNETLSLEAKLGIDGKRSDQSIKSSIELPFSYGKKVCALLISDSEEISSKNIGDSEIIVVGKDDLTKIGKGEFPLKKFNKVLTYEKMMKDITITGSSKTLGMAGLMPSAKTGTIFKTDEDLIKGYESALLKKVEIKSDKFGYLKFAVGKLDMNIDELKENILCAQKAIVALKPESFNDVFVLRIIVSSTMGFSESVVV